MSLDDLAIRAALKPVQAELDRQKEKNGRLKAELADCRDCLAQARRDHQSEADALRVERNAIARELAAETALLEATQAERAKDVAAAMAELAALRGGHVITEGIARLVDERTAALLAKVAELKAERNALLLAASGTAHAQLSDGIARSAVAIEALTSERDALDARAEQFGRGLANCRKNCAALTAALAAAGLDRDEAVQARNQDAAVADGLREQLAARLDAVRAVSGQPPTSSESEAGFVEQALCRCVTQRDRALDRVQEQETALAEWAAKDGNSPGYNLEKARTYGRLAAEHKARAEALVRAATSLLRWADYVNNRVGVRMGDLDTGGRDAVREALAAWPGKARAAPEKT